MKTGTDNANVISLNFDKHNGARSSEAAMKENLARLPAAVQRAHEVAHAQLKASIQNLFDHVDDALFELADRAASNLEQNVFFESMREIRIHRRAMEKSFVENIGLRFTALLDDNIPVLPSKELDASTDDLSLVSKDELEELVAIDSLVSKTWVKNKSVLHTLSLRLNYLYEINASEDNNPLTPRALADSFVNASELIDVDIKAKLVLFKLFERYVMNELPELLTRVNQTLTEMGVPAPKPRTGGSRTRRSSGAPLSHYGATNTNTPAPDSRASGNEATGLYTTLQSLLQQPQAPVSSQAQFSETSYAGSDDGYQVQEVSYDLLQALSRLQQQQLQQAPLTESLQTGQPQLLTTNFIQTALSADSSEGLVDKHSQDVIKLVDMLFTFIMEDRNLPDPIKLLLTRLQIPFIKVALADETFFKKDGHPARRLLNEMATASIGWAGDVSGNKRDPLLAKVESTVTRVLEEFDSNFEIFTLLLTDFIAFQEKERRRAMLFEKRALDAEDGKAKAEIGRQEVDHELVALMQGNNVPEAFAQFIQGPWSNILFLIYMRQGKDSQQWQNALRLAKELIWSASPIANAAHKKKLAELVPQLQTALKKGLQNIAFNPVKQAKFFEQFKLHYRELLNQYMQPAPAAAEAPVTETPVAPVNETSSAPAVKPIAEDFAKAEAEVAALGETAALDESMAVPNSVEKMLQEQVETPQVADADIANTATAEMPAQEQASAPAEQQAFVQEQETAQVSAQQPAPTPAEPVQAEVVEEPVVAQQPEPVAPATPEASVPESTEPEQTQTAPVADSQYLNLVDNFVVGVWFEKVDQGTSVFRCRLAAIIRGTGKYIFVNRAGIKVAEETRESLALQLQAGHLRTLDDGTLFDRALESVISNLRQR